MVAYGVKEAGGSWMVIIVQLTFREIHFIALQTWFEYFDGVTVAWLLKVYIVNLAIFGEDTPFTSVVLYVFGMF
jgi:hypothetical protein